MQNISSLFFKLTLIIVAFHFVIHFIQKLLSFIISLTRIKTKGLKRERLKALVCSKKTIVPLLVVTILFLALGSIWVTKGITFNYSFLTKFLVFALTIMYVYIIYSSKPSFVVLKAIVILFSLLGLFLFLSFASGFGREWRGIKAGSGLTINYYNPNFAAEVLFFVIIFSFVGVFIFRPFILKFYFVSIIFLANVLLYLTSARNPYITIVFSFLFSYLSYLFLKRKKERKMTNIILSASLVLSPLLFANIYTIVCYYLDKYNIKINIGGKAADTRYEVWVNSFKEFLKKPIIGCYSTLGDGSGSFQLHNSHIDVLVAYGLPIFILLSVCLFIIYYDLITESQKRKNGFLGIMLAASAIIFGFSEASFLYSGSATFVIAFLMIWLPKMPLVSNKFVQSFELTGNQYIFNNKTTMKVLSINSVYKKGSTGSIVHDIHTGILEDGYESFVIYGRGTITSDRNVIKIGNEIYSKFNQFLFKVFKRESMICFINTFRIIDTILEIKPDIVHLHGTNDYYMNFKLLLHFLAKKRIKTIITLHSELLYLGNCGGNAYECTNWSKENGLMCNGCPLSKKQTPTKELKTKRDCFKAFPLDCLTVTTVSPWLESRAKQSYVMQGTQIITIENGINVKEIPNINEDESTIENDKTVIFITASLDNPNKGSKYLKQLALENKDIKFKVFSLEKTTQDFPTNIHIFPPTTNKQTLYNQIMKADCTLILSKSETFSMPVIESLCCGTPVVGFAAGGPESRALPNYSTFVKYGDINDLSKAMIKMINKKFLHKTISSEAISLYSNARMLCRYLNLYKQMIKEKPIFSYYEVNI